MTKLFGFLLAAVAVALVLANPAVAQDAAKARTKVKRPDVEFRPSPQAVVDKMLDLAVVTPDDVVYDMGCGDGIIIVSAAKRGARAVGFEIDPQFIRESRENIAKNNVGELAKVVPQDMFKQDLSGASVVMLYLIPSLNEKLIPQLEQLKPGSRIVSHNVGIKGMKPDKVVKVRGPKGTHTLYLWHAPLQREDAAQ
jgi:SAM-dependent methyltransferase